MTFLKIAWFEYRRRIRSKWFIIGTCKSIRNDEGFWEQVEVYLTDHSDAELTHSLCPICVKKLYPEIASKNNL